MRKDIFLVGTRLLGLWQVCGAVVSLCYIITEYVGYIRPQSSSHEYNLVHFFAELIIGLFLITRPQNVFRLVQRLSLDEDEDKAEESSSEEPGSQVK